MILVDAHVHIYDCFDLQAFLDSALANFKAEVARCGQEDAFTALLLLTETAKDNWFQRLTGYVGNNLGIGSKAIGKWTFHRTNENCSLLARCNGGQGLYVIAGRQIVTAEDLEVLALATDRGFEDGAPLEDVIETVKNNGAIPVIPWGPGKWMGHRGMILKDLLKAVKEPGLFLGDNGGRPIFWARPSHFKEAEAKGIRILSGSDPLPFASESRRPGSFGFSVEASITHEQPAKDIRRILLDPTTYPRAYGALENPYRFFLNQLAMQMTKQLRKRKWVD